MKSKTVEVETVSVSAEERLYTVFLCIKGKKDSVPVVPLATTTTKQRANGFIVKTQNLWKEYDMDSQVELHLFEKKGKGKKANYEPVE